MNLLSKSKNAKRLRAAIASKIFTLIRFVKIQATKAIEFSKDNKANLIAGLISTTISAVLALAMLNTQTSTFDTSAVLTNLLTINGIISAVLITYLFSRIMWTNERKLEVYNEAIGHSQKITEFRRILKILIQHYNVWANDRQTKSLIDHGRFERLDFYDLRLHFENIGEPRNHDLVTALLRHPDYSEGMTTTYLAMASIVNNREVGYHWQEELYKDFLHKDVYEFAEVKRWWQCALADSIGYWMNHDPDWIRYGQLRRDEPEIMAAAARINSKYSTYQLGNKLIEELAQDTHHHVTSLYRLLLELRKGIEGISLFTTYLVLASLSVGVLAPFVLLLLQNDTQQFQVAVKILSAVNVALMVFFIARFPSLLARELKWI